MMHRSEPRRALASLMISADSVNLALLVLMCA